MSDFEPNFDFESMTADERLILAAELLNKRLSQPKEPSIDEERCREVIGLLGLVDISELSGKEILRHVGKIVSIYQKLTGGQYLHQRVNQIRSVVFEAYFNQLKEDRQVVRELSRSQSVKLGYTLRLNP